MGVCMCMCKCPLEPRERVAERVWESKMRSVFFVRVPLELEQVILVDTLVIFEVRVVFAGAMCIYRSMRSLFRVCGLGFRCVRRPMRSLRQQAVKANKRRCMSAYVCVVCHA